MDRQTLTDNWAAVILYYCGLQGTAHYKQDLSDVCEYSYNGENQTYITNWLLSSPYTEPSIATLQSYTLSTCTTYYANAYVLPDSIASNQPWVSLNSTQIGDIIMTSLNDGQFIFNTTTKRVMFYDHSVPGFKTVTGS